MVDQRGGKTTGCTLDPVTAACTVLRWLANPIRSRDIELMICMHGPVLSKVFYKMIQWLILFRGCLLENIRHLWWKYTRMQTWRQSTIERALSAIVPVLSIAFASRYIESLVRELYRGRRTRCIRRSSVSSTKHWQFSMTEWITCTGRRFDSTMIWLFIERASSLLYCKRWWLSTARSTISTTARSTCCVPDY